MSQLGRRGGVIFLHTPSLDTEMHFRLRRVRDRVPAKLDVGTVFEADEKDVEGEREKGWAGCID